MRCGQCGLVGRSSRSADLVVMGLLSCEVDDPLLLGACEGGRGLVRMERVCISVKTASSHGAGPCMRAVWGVVKGSE